MQRDVVVERSNGPSTANDINLMVARQAAVRSPSADLPVLYAKTDQRRGPGFAALFVTARYDEGAEQPLEIQLYDISQHESVLLRYADGAHVAIEDGKVTINRDWVQLNRH